jgi:catechol 2,3-dioxygenase-like lactoylglutathione lyase family enzyme
MLTTAQIVPYIPVADIDRARKFYEEKVGLKPKETYAGGVIYECGHGSWLFMYPSAGAGTSKASTAFWAVDDVVAERITRYLQGEAPGLGVDRALSGAATDAPRGHAPPAESESLLRRATVAGPVPTTEPSSVPLIAIRNH